MTEFEEWICTKCNANPCFCEMETGQIPTTCIQALKYDNSAKWKMIEKKQKKKLDDINAL